MSRANPWAGEPGVIACRMAHTSNGAYSGGPWKLALHITAYDPGGVIGFEQDQGGSADYHVPYDPMRDQLMAPFYPLTESARALRRSSAAGTVQTNRDRVLQPTLCGSVAQIQNLTVAQLERIGRRLIAPIMRDYPEIRFRRQPPLWHSRANGATGRLTVAEWDLWDGFCGHQHVPAQDPTWHWDPCMTNAQINTIVTAAEQELQPTMATVVETLVMPAVLPSGGTALLDVGTVETNVSPSEVRSLTTSKMTVTGSTPGVPYRGYIEVHSDGAVHTFFGAPFFGAMNVPPLPVGEVIVGACLTPAADGFIAVSNKGGVFIPTNGSTVNRAVFRGSAYPRATQGVAALANGYRLIHGPGDYSDFTS